MLIIGVGGGVGSAAVGIGKRLGGHVTGVCSAKDVERIEALGADVVIDRKKSDPLDAKSTYDVVFDTPAVYSFGRCVRILRAGAAYVTTLPNAALITGLARALFSSKRADLELVGGWLSDGLEVAIDSCHRIADLGAAFKHQADPAQVGRVVIDVADGWPSEGVGCSRALRSPQRVVSRIVALDESALADYPGNYSDYQAAKA